MLESGTWSGWNQDFQPTNLATQPGFDPIDNDMEHEDQRLRSFQRNNGWRGAVEPWKLAQAGFYYTGINDHVKCFACDVSLKAWLPGEDPVKEHLKIQPNCSYISRLGNKFSITRTPNISLEETTSTQPMISHPFRSTSYDPSISYQQSVSAPVNRVPASKPNYASEHARLHTFINWPKDCPVQPKELIDAGFYYTGNEDKVECFKCGIILAGWEPEDTPWGEHEKWAKDCPLVAEHFQRRNPQSPSQGHRAQVLPQEQTWETPVAKLGNHPEPIAGPSETKQEMKASNVVRLPSEQGECPKGSEQDRKTKDSSKPFYVQEAVQTIVESGQYDYGTVNEAYQYRTKIEGKKINSMNELLDAVQSYVNTSNKKCTPEDNSAASNNPSTNSGGFSLCVNPESLKKIDHKYADAHRCKICLDAEIGIVFLPCGHIVCCPECAKKIQKGDCLCPICRKHIQNTIRSYLT